MNVVCIDWADGAVDPNYVRAAVNTRLVGKQVSNLYEISPLREFNCSMVFQTVSCVRLEKTVQPKCLKVVFVLFFWDDVCVTPNACRPGTSSAVNTALIQL